MARGQNYTERLDTFYVPTPEYSVTLGIDSLHFPCAITQPNSGSNFPVLILVHGTSALDKDASSTKDFKESAGASSRKAQIRMFYEIADFHSSNGIMVLRYDKRSFTLNCIEKPECWSIDTISPYDYIKDIHYAVEFAKTIPGVDTCNIFLAGHSQGGSFVAEVGYKRQDIKGVISLAQTAQPIDTVAVFQTKTVDDDPSGAAILRDQFDALRAGLWPMTDTLYKQHFSPRFWLDWIQQTDSAVITQQQSDVPTLIMYGSKDKFAPPTIHMKIWEDSIARPDVTLLTLDALDHSFGTEFDSTMSTEGLNAMANWIHANSINCNIVTGLSDTHQDDQLKIYPNPTQGYLTIDAIDSGTMVEVWSMTGFQRFSTHLKNGQIDISGLGPGVYILRILTAFGIQTARVVKI